MLNHMAVDPQAQPALEFIRSTPPLNTLGVQGAREWARGRKPLSFPDPAPVSIEDRTLEGDGRPLRVRAYFPDAQGPLPVIVFAHSGGWIMGSVASGDAFCGRLAARSRCAVLSVDYRLAPEHPFPAPVDDLAAVVDWVRREGAAAGLEPSKICLAGESSGGNLAAGACIKLRDEGAAGVALQLLVCPVIDPSMSTDSWHEFGEGYSPNREQMAWMWDLYAGGAPMHPYVAPLSAATLEGLPPAIILTAEYDPLADEAELYGAELRKAGVDATVHRCAGQIHAVFSYAALVDRCREALDAVADDVADVFRGVPR